MDLARTQFYKDFPHPNHRFYWSQQHFQGYYYDYLADTYGRHPQWLELGYGAPKDVISRLGF